MPKDASPPLLLHHHHFSSSSLRRSALACSTKKTEEARRRSQICAETEEAKRTEETEGDLSRAPLPSDDLLSVSSGSLKPIGWGLGRDDGRDGRRSALHRCRHFLAHRRPVCFSSFDFFPHSPTLKASTIPSAFAFPFDFLDLS